MCLGMVGQVLAVGSDGSVEVDAGDRVITASLLACLTPSGPATGCSCTRGWCLAG